MNQFLPRFLWYYHGGVEMEYHHIGRPELLLARLPFRQSSFWNRTHVANYINILSLFDRKRIGPSFTSHVRLRARIQLLQLKVNTLDLKYNFEFKNKRLQRQKWYNWKCCGWVTTSDTIRYDTIRPNSNTSGVPCMSDNKWEYRAKNCERMCVARLNAYRSVYTTAWTGKQKTGEQKLEDHNGKCHIRTWN